VTWTDWHSTQERVTLWRRHSTAIRITWWRQHENVIRDVVASIRVHNTRRGDIYMKLHYTLLTYRFDDCVKTCLWSSCSSGSWGRRWWWQQRTTLEDHDYPGDQPDQEVLAETCKEQLRSCPWKVLPLRPSPEWQFFAEKPADQFVGVVKSS